MRLTKNFKDARVPDTGGMLLEAAMLLPLLITIFIGTYSLISLIRVYMSLHQIVREAVLSVATVDEVEGCTASDCIKTDLVFNQAEYEMCLSDGIPYISGPAYLCGHIVTQWNIQRLNESYALPLIGISMTTTYDNVEEVFRVDISGTLNDSISILNGKELQAAGLADYS